MFIQLFIFKVAVKDDRGVWLRIIMRADQSLDQLHRMIHKGFGYDNSAGYLFKIPPEGRSGTARKWLSRYYSHPAALQESADESLYDAALTDLSGLELKSRFRFEYLTGKQDRISWREHLVIVEEDQADDQCDSYPQIIDQKGVPAPL